MVNYLLEFKASTKSSISKQVLHTRIKYVPVLSVITFELMRWQANPHLSHLVIFYPFVADLVSIRFTDRPPVGGFGLFVWIVICNCRTPRSVVA